MKSPLGKTLALATVLAAFGIAGAATASASPVDVDALPASSISITTDWPFDDLDDLDDFIRVPGAFVLDDDDWDDWYDDDWYDD